MEFKRSDRLTELLKEEIGAALRKVKDPRLAGLLTITDVELAGDLKSAVVYFSVYGSEQEKQSSSEALESAAPFIRGRLRERLRLKFIPTLKFEFDDTPERAGRVLELLNEIERERQASPPPPPPPAPEEGPKPHGRKKGRRKPD